MSTACRHLLVEQGRPLLERLGGREALADMQSSAGDLVKQGGAWLLGFLRGLWSGGQALIGIFALLVVTPVVAFYMLVDWDRMVGTVDAWVPVRHRDTVRALAREIDQAIAGFVRGQALVCLILGTFYAVALALIGLNFGALIGMTAGFLSFIPYVGSLTGLLVSVGVALVQFWPDWTWILATLGGLRRRAVLRGQHPVAEARRRLRRPAPGVADVRALRLRLAVRLRRTAAGGAARGRGRRARPLRAPAATSQARSTTAARPRWRRPRPRPSRPVAMTEAPKQLTLELPLEPRFGREDFLVSPSNEHAYALHRALAGLARYRSCSSRARRAAARAISPRSGRRNRTRWTVDAFEVGTDQVPHLVSNGALVIEDCDPQAGDEPALFHLLNLARERRAYRADHDGSRRSRSCLRTPDLLSRLRLAPSVSLDPPDDALLRAVLVKLFIDRQLVVDTTVVDYPRPADRALARRRGRDAWRRSTARP